MYLLLLIGHITLAVTATTPGLTEQNTPGLTEQDLQTHISQSDAVTNRHADASSDHTAATTGAKGAPVLHTDAVTNRHADASSDHTAATTGAKGAPVIHTDAVTNAHADASSDHTAATTGAKGAPVIHTDAVTNAHADASSDHTAATTGAKGAPVLHTVRQPSETQTPHQGHVSPTQLQRVSTEAFAGLHVSVDHPTSVRHSDSIRRHPTVTKMELPPTVGKRQAAQVMAGSVSAAPVLTISIIDKIHHFTCVWDLGPRDAHYELFQGVTMVENVTVHGKEAAVFKHSIPPGPMELYCRVRTPSGEMVISKPMRITGDAKESDGKAQDKTKSDTEERDAGPNFLISLNKILTSVTQPVQDLNIIIISVCGPVVLVVLLMVIITHLCNCRERKLGPFAA